MVETDVISPNDSESGLSHELAVPGSGPTPSSLHEPGQRVVQLVQQFGRTQHEVEVLGIREAGGTTTRLGDPGGRRRGRCCRPRGGEQTRLRRLVWRISHLDYGANNTRRAGLRTEGGR